MSDVLPIPASPTTATSALRPARTDPAVVTIDAVSACLPNSSGVVVTSRA
jgi:hypothetical protein